jgi:hypothetical protein
MAVVEGVFGRARVERRKASGETVVIPADAWQGCDDSTLLAWLHSLPAGHGRDADVLDIVASPRHLYVRQAAAVAVSDPDHLLNFLRNRQMGPVLTRQLSRVEDLAYLADLVQSSRHPEVRRLACAHLQQVSARLLQQVGPSAK